MLASDVAWDDPETLGEVEVVSRWRWEPPERTGVRLCIDCLESLSDTPERSPQGRCEVCEYKHKRRKVKSEDAG